MKRIFHEALERPLDQRTAFLEHACQRDAELLRMVQALLASDWSADRVMGMPAAARVALGPSGPSLVLGDRMTMIDLARATGSIPTQSLDIRLLLWSPCS